MKRFHYFKSLKQISIRIGARWDFVVSWRSDWRFVGLVEGCGFGRYVGIKI